ncbi:MAG: DUF2330 domain-containing protein [Myxococcota bacterium]
MVARWAASVGIASIIAFGPSFAFGGVFVTQSETTARPTKIQAVISHAQNSTTIIERWTLRSNARRFALLLPFPSQPDIVIAPKLSFAKINRLTTVKAPHNHAVRRDLFGPSNVSILLNNLVDTPKKPPKTDAEDAAKILTVIDYEVFSGDVQTSTITGKLNLPQPMHRWFRQQGFQPSERIKASIAGHLNRGWVIAAVELDNPSASLSTQVITPSMKFRFSSKEPLLPLMRQPEPWATEPVFDIWTVGSSQLLPTSFTVRWEQQPWRPETAAPSKFVAVYGGELGARDPLTSILKGDFRLRLPPTPHIVRYRFRHGQEVWEEKAFAPAPRTVNIPGFGQRGRLFDIILCVLLGLTPLLFTPESWFLLWLGARGQVTLWGLYAIVVAVYWTLTLEGIGRVAATAPLIIGLGQLLWPAQPSQQEFVRVQFKDSNKKAGRPAERT